MYLIIYNNINCIYDISMECSFICNINYSIDESKIKLFNFQGI